MKYLPFLISACFLFGCEDSSDVEIQENHINNQEEISIEESNQNKIKVFNAQGNALAAAKLTLTDYKKEDLSCLDSSSLSAVNQFIGTLKSRYEHQLLKEKVCSVSKLYLAQKSEVTYSLIAPIGFNGIVNDLGELNDWALEYALALSPDTSITPQDIQSGLDEFHHRQQNIWPRQLNLSFDDGAALNSLYANLDLFDKYNAEITLFISHYALLDKSKIKQIEAYGHEIGHHGTLHRHAKLYSEEHGVASWLEEDILNQLGEMQGDGLQIASYAYPFGDHTDETDEALKAHFSYIRKFSGWSGVNYKSQRSDQQFIMGYSIDAHNMDLDKIFRAIDEIKGGETLYLGTHTIGEFESDWHITPENLEAVLKYAHESGVRLCKISECVNFDEGIAHYNMRILTSQGKPSAMRLSLHDFQSSALSCEIEGALDEVIHYLKRTDEVLTFNELDKRLCSINSLYSLSGKSQLDIELLINSGLSELTNSKGEVDTWAFEEILNGLNSAPFKASEIQARFDEFIYNRDNIWPKQVNISFDDGGALESLIEYLPLFDKYNAQITFFMSHYDYLDKSKVLKLQERGHEIGHHGTLHRHAQNYAEEHGVDKWLEDDILGSLQQMKEDGIHISSFAYPFGAHTRHTDLALKDKFKYIRKFSGWSGVRYKSQRSDQQFIMGYSIDAHTIDLDKIFQAIDALRGGETLYLGTHTIGHFASDWHITPENLEAILKYVSESEAVFCRIDTCSNFR